MGSCPIPSTCWRTDDMEHSTSASQTILDDVYSSKAKAIKGFTAKYDVGRLVWMAPFDDINDAIAYE